MAFVHAELSFCVSSRFCLSLWRWRCGRGQSLCSADLGTESRGERRGRYSGAGPVVQVQVFARPTAALISWQAE